MVIKDFVNSVQLSTRFSIGGSSRPNVGDILTLSGACVDTSLWTPNTENAQEITFFSVVATNDCRFRFNGLLNAVAGTLISKDGIQNNYIATPSGFLTDCVKTARKALFSVKKNNDEKDDDFAKRQATEMLIAFFSALYDAEINENTDLSKLTAKIKFIKVEEMLVEERNYHVFIYNTEKVTD